MINNKKILLIGILGGITIGGIVGRIVYLNFSMDAVAEKNFTPEVQNELTNGDPASLDAVPDTTTTQDNQ
jgi:hypothetical protein